MPKTTPPFPPSFETDEELYALLQEGLDSDDEGIQVPSDEWDRFKEELLTSTHVQKLAS